MVVVRWFVLVLSLVLAVAASDLAAQNRSSFSNPAEYDAYMAALNTRDADQARDGDGSLHRLVSRQRAAHRCLRAGDGGLAGRQPAGQGRRHRRQAAADRSRQCARARQSRLCRARPRHPGRSGGDGARWSRRRSAAWPPCPSGRSRPALTDAVFARTRQQMGAVFNGTLGYAALQAKDYDKARRHYREAVAAEPDNLQDVYQLAVSQLEGTPLDALGFWYAARAIAIARAAKNEAAASDIDRYVRSRYRIYRGSEEGWNELLARVVAGEHAPPAGFVKSIPRALTPAEAGGAGRRGQRSRLAVLFRLGARAAPSRRHAGQQGRGREGVEGDRRQAAGRRHAAQDPGEGDQRHARRHRGGDHRRGAGGQHRRPAHRHGPSAGAAAGGRRQDLDRRHPERLSGRSPSCSS